MPPEPPTLPGFTDAIARYGEHLAARNFAPNTRLSYTSDLQGFVAFLRAHSRVSHPADVDRRDLEAFLTELDRQGLAGTSRRRKVAALRSFFAFLEEHGHLSANPSVKLIPPAREERQPRVLTEAEYKRLIEAARGQTRDAAIIEVLLQTGMRVSELTRLSIHDVELPAKPGPHEGGHGSVRIYGKGRKERTVTLNWKACRVVKAYLAVRPQAYSSALFLTKFQQPFSRRAVHQLVEKYLTAAGVAGATVHTLRHTFGTHHARRKTALPIIRDALGHASLKTTERYVHLARELMDKELQANAL
jgi:site-specific recombinase XerD